MILANAQKRVRTRILLFPKDFVLDQIKVCYNLIRSSCESVDLGFSTNRVTQSLRIETSLFAILYQRFENLKIDKNIFEQDRDN